jgi:apolipoprotein N-acyltransferase
MTLAGARRRPCETRTQEMSEMPSVVASERDIETETARALGARQWRSPVVAGLAAGLLLWTSFPPLEWSWFAWIALAPLFWLVVRRGSALPTYLAAWLGGLVFWLLALEWVRLSDPSAWLGWAVLALIFSFWWPAFVAVARWAVFRLRVPLIVAAPIIWVGLEFLRAYFLSGLPWYYLAHTQFRLLYVIQIADFAGSLGVSFLIATFNALAVDLVTLPLFARVRRARHLSPRQNVRLCAVTILVGSALCYGAYRVSSARFPDGPKLALLQSNVPQSHKLRGNSQEMLSEFVALVQDAIAQAPVPELIVWPETAYPYGYIIVETGVDRSTLERQVRSITKKLTVDEWEKNRQLITDDLHGWVDQIQIPMLIGSSCYLHRPTALEKYNSALLFQPARPGIDLYHKMHLVPFGEYVPFIETLPWLAVLTPYSREKVPSLSFGQEAVSLPMGPYRLAVSICFEDTIPHVIRRFFEASARGAQPDVLVNLSNDGWFHGSPELDMHLAIGVFRAVENRVPLARAVNTGLSALVDGNGEIRAALPKESKGVLSVTVPLDPRESLYSRWGDWLGLSCLAVTIGLLPMGLVWRMNGTSRRL